MKILLSLGVALTLAVPANAEIRQIPYSDLKKTLSGRITFETLPQRPEPGFNLNHAFRSSGAWIGQHFSGQSITTTVSSTSVVHDTLGHELAHSPLEIQSGSPNRNLSVTYHRGFGSNAILPLGPLGFHDVSGRGEGALAVLFDTDQYAFGFRVHTDYADPLGTHADRGKITVHFMSRSGDHLAQVDLQPTQGITNYGFEGTGNTPEFAGILICNTDPGGIAIDDILFQVEMMLF